jgi:hypothetical protein
MKIQKRPLFAGVAAIFFCNSASIFAADAADANAVIPITPYRPSVSDSAQLPAVGQLELELGGAVDTFHHQRRYALPSLLKLAFSREWGVLLGSDGLVSEKNEQGRRQTGFGDTSVTAKRAWIVDEETAFGLELAALLPTGAKKLGAEKTDYTANGIYSQDWGKWHADFNVSFTHLGLHEPSVSRWQTGLANSWSYAVSEAWSATAEWSGTYRTGDLSGSQLLFALSFSPTQRLTFDVGVTKGLRKGTNSASADHGFFAGVVLPLGRVF